MQQFPVCSLGGTALSAALGDLTPLSSYPGISSAMGLSYCVQLTPDVPFASPVEVAWQKDSLINTSHEKCGVSSACPLVQKFRMWSLLVGGIEQMTSYTVVRTEASGS